MRWLFWIPSTVNNEANNPLSVQVKLVGGQSPCFFVWYNIVVLDSMLQTLQKQTPEKLVKDS